MGNKKTLLIADDSQLLRKILSDTLHDEYTLLEAKNGLETIELLQAHSNTISALLLDLVMPGLDGFEVMTFMRQTRLLDIIPVIIITAEDSESILSMAYDMGVSEVIIKPFNRNIVKKRIRNIIDLYEQKNNLKELVTQQTKSLISQAKKLKETNEMMIDMLSTVIEYRSLESGQHIKRIRGFTRIILNCLTQNVPRFRFSKSEIDMISSAAAMHDVGKIAIPDSVLLKPGKLTPEEFEVMKTHTTMGCEILYRLSGIDDKQYLSYCHDICLSHHERWDGNGYPDGLAGDEIPIAAQVVSIADVYDALTHKRVYKDAYSLDKTVSMILSGKCGVFSPVLLECFKLSLPQFEKLSQEYHDETF